MYNTPFFGFPFYKNYYQNKYYPKQNTYSNQMPKNEEKSLLKEPNNESNNKKNSTTDNNSSSTINNNSRNYTSNSQAYLNILGIDLYSDDILILCILLSLYLEGVKDEMLFISLILLLLS